MPRAAAKPKTEPVEDPLADLRDDDAARYPQDGQGGPQDGPEAPGEADPLTAFLLERLEAAMAIPLDADGVITAEARDMATALATEAAADLAPMLETVQATSADEAVERWHADTVAVGFLHKGGRCGCAYIARVVLGA
jgi:hypothetical protein